MTFFCVLCLVTSITLSGALLCPGSAKYKLIFEAEWTAQSHPEDFPSGHNPHFSSLVGCSHNASYVMWKSGIKATQGVKDVAERGNTNALNREMKEQITLGRVLYKFVGRGNGNIGTVTQSDIQVNSRYPLVSAITMIAQSPDWFVGVHDYSLCNETTGKWVDERVKDLFLYDSGTDSAPRFVHRDTPTVPPVPIFLITNTHEGSLKSNNTIKRFGTFTFEKTFDSSAMTPSMRPSSSTTRNKAGLFVCPYVPLFTVLITLGVFTAVYAV